MPGASRGVQLLQTCPALAGKRHELDLAQDHLPNILKIIHWGDLVNDTYACENNRTLNQILKGHYGFRGYIMSDWSAQESTMSAVAGLDVRLH